MAKKVAKKTQAIGLIDTPDTRQLALPVSQNVQIIGVRLIDCDVRCDPRVEARKQVVQVGHDCRTEQREGHIAVFVNVRVRTGRQDESTGFELVATFALTYEVKELQEFPKANLEAFGQLNGVFNAWPYIREFVQSMSTRMGFGALTLPVHRPPASKSETGASVAVPKGKIGAKKSPKRKG